jgi:hypothetical protein
MNLRQRYERDGLLIVERFVDPAVTRMCVLRSWSRSSCVGQFG